MDLILRGAARIQSRNFFDRIPVADQTSVRNDFWENETAKELTERKERVLQCFAFPAFFSG